MTLKVSRKIQGLVLIPTASFIHVFFCVSDGCCSFQVDQYLVHGQKNGLSPEEYFDILDLDLYDTSKKLVYIKVGVYVPSLGLFCIQFLSNIAKILF